MSLNLKMAACLNKKTGIDCLTGVVKWIAYYTELLK